jgi:hypothetical protein
MIDKPSRVRSRLDHVILLSLIYDTPGREPGRHCQRTPFLLFTVDVVSSSTFLRATYVTEVISRQPTGISRTITHGHCQHDGEEVCGVTVVVGASTRTISSWFGPPNA